MYNLRLFELLHKLPQPSQDKITALAQEDADCFCTKYELTLTDHKDTAYRYYLSTLVKEMYRVNNEHPMPEFNDKVPLSVPVRQVCNEAYPAKVFGDTIAHLAMPWM